MSKTPYAELSIQKLTSLQKSLQDEYQAILNNSSSLDLTRGKPSSEQLDLSNEMLNYAPPLYSQNQDIRNYGLLSGTKESRQLGEQLLNIPEEYIISFGNSSLFLMYLAIETALFFGLGTNSPWRSSKTTSTPVKFFCPVPGYDRHHTICDSLAIEMIPLPMTSEGPDIDLAINLIKEDPYIKGIWCIPKYSNPTGVTYSKETIEKICHLASINSKDFLVIWDNAYSVHDLYFPSEESPNIYEITKKSDTFNQMIFTASTSKITFAGAGSAFVASAPEIQKSLLKRLSFLSINPDKVSQQKNAFFLLNKLNSHMQQHASILRPKFELAIKHLENNLHGLGIAEWTNPKGGYFISLNTSPFLAKRVVEMAKNAQLLLTPAGATFPYGKDPLDQNIRIAPSFPSLSELDSAMHLLTLCIRLASIEQILTKKDDAKKDDNPHH